METQILDTLTLGFFCLVAGFFWGGVYVLLKKENKK